MSRTYFYLISNVVKSLLPHRAFSLLRSLFTAVVTPYYSFYKSGFFNSAFLLKSVTLGNDPVPWYSYPAIIFLSQCQFKDKSVLEFGGGQSTLWWSTRALSVTTFEVDSSWHHYLSQIVPSNVNLYKIDTPDTQDSSLEVLEKLGRGGRNEFDIIIIDGLNRNSLIQAACSLVSSNGAIICDNSEGYGFYDSFLGKNFQRVDFYGHSPGVFTPQATSIYFRDKLHLI